MRKWKFTIKKGKELRELIFKHDSVGVILKLREICDDLIKKGYDEFEELYYLLEGEDDIIKEGRLEEFNWNNDEELVDDRLTEFYDLCDNNDIFVGL